MTSKNLAYDDVFKSTKVPYLRLVRQDPQPPPTKQDVIQSLLYFWNFAPTLRLGQLLESTRISQGLGKDLFYVDDNDLILAIEKFIAETNQQHPVNKLGSTEEDKGGAT